MKAALEAWGAGSNLFHQGVAKESSDPEVIAATMSKPGVALPAARARIFRLFTAAASDDSSIGHIRSIVRGLFHLPKSTSSSSPHKRIKAIPPLITPERIPEAFGCVPVIAERNAS
jgi:hypothetical protein